MYRLTRTSTEPGSPLKIMIARPDGADAGLSAGGSFVLDPGDVIQVDPYVAGVIMGDPGLAKHFDCLPPWGVTAAADAAPVVEAVPADPVIDEVPVAEPEPSKWEPSARKRRG